MIVLNKKDHINVVGYVENIIYNI